MSPGEGPRCRVCGSDESTVISRNVSESPDAAIYRCGACDMVYQHPIMTEAQEAAFYLEHVEKYMEGRSGPGWKSPGPAPLGSGFWGIRRS